MYEQFYGLDARPFDLTPDPRYLVLTAVHREALSNLEYAIGSRKGVTLLLGEAGTGQDHDHPLGDCEAAGAKPLRASAQPGADQGRVRADAGRAVLVERARPHVEDRPAARARAVAAETARRPRDDGAHRRRGAELTSELLEEVRLLTNIETDAEKLLSLVIAGQPEFADSPGRAVVAPVEAADRAALRAAAVDPARDLRLCRRAGLPRPAACPAKMFTREAVILIHEYSRGIPRTINVIADNALLGGFATGQRTVTRQRVFEACCRLRHRRRRSRRRANQRRRSA